MCVYVDFDNRVWMLTWSGLRLIAIFSFEEMGLVGCENVRKKRVL